MGNETNVKIISLLSYPVKPDLDGNYYKSFFIVLFLI